MIRPGNHPIENPPPVDRQERDAVSGELVDFFPDEPEQSLTKAKVREVLKTGSREQRAWVMSHLLRFARWDEIWDYVTRDEVREMFPHLDMPEELQVAWGRMLKVDSPADG